MLDNNPDYYGNDFKWFIGVVVRVVDDTYVQVRCFGIHGIDREKLPDTDLPYALVLMPTTGGQSGSGHFTHDLSINTWVFGFFADGDNCTNPVVVGVINGTQYSMSDQYGGGGQFVGQDTGYADPGTPDSSGTPSDTPPVDSQATRDIPGDGNVAKTYNYVYQKLTEEGDSDPHLHAAALTGSLMLESGTSINPQIVNNSSGAYGIAQWLGNRKVGLKHYAGSSPDLAQELDYLWWELNHSESRAKAAWLSASNLPDSVAGFCKFERAEEVSKSTGQVDRNHPNYRTRLKYAYQIYNSMSAAPSV